MVESEFLPDESEKNMIKRNIDLENIENFLNVKYHQINKNDASEDLSEEDFVIQKRDNSHLHNSIRKLENAIDENDDLMKHFFLPLDDSEETAQLVAKDLDEIEAEMNAMDRDIFELLESAKLLDNSIHKRIRHKRETSHSIDPVAYKHYAPILEEKKREKRLVQQKLAEVRDEFIRCKKSAPGENSDCDRIYDRVMDRFREITKKFKEIEEIVDEMEHFNPSKRNDSDEDHRKEDDSDEKRKKKDKKKKDKKKKGKKSSEESEESPEKKKDKHQSTSTTFPVTPPRFPADLIDPNEFPTTTLETTTEDHTTIETTTIFNDDPNSIENIIPRDNDERFEAAMDYHTEEQRPLTQDSAEQKISKPDESSTKSSKPEITSTKTEKLTTDHTLQLTTTEFCPANAFGTHSKFQEDLDDHHSFFKPRETVEHFVAQKLEKSQRSPFDGLLDDASNLFNDAKDLMDHVIDNDKKTSAESKELQSTKTTSKTGDVGASGPFIALCEQMAKQSKQAQPQFENHNFGPVPVPLSSFTNQPFQFPSTGETTKTSSKVMMNPGYNLMPYPICFVNYPQYRMPQQQFYYPGLIPGTQPGGKIDNLHHDIIDPEFIRSRNSGGA